MHTGNTFGEFVQRDGIIPLRYLARVMWVDVGTGTPSVKRLIVLSVAARKNLIRAVRR